MVSCTSSPTEPGCTIVSGPIWRCVGSTSTVRISGVPRSTDSVRGLDAVAADEVAGLVALA
jgi:hypothetical protein